MKSFYRLFSLVAILFICLFSNEVKATHFKGGDIYFVCQGNGLYKLVFTCYYSCEVNSSLPYPLSSISWTLTSSCVGVPTTLQAIAPTTATLGNNLPLYCPGVLTTCDYSYNTGAIPPAGTPDGTLYVNYESDTFRIPDNCTVTAVMDQGSRNAAVTNLTSPNTQDLNIQAAITTDATGSCNNSPQFNTYPVNVFCLNQRASFNHGANNLNGDSLTYTLVNPRTAAGAAIPFNTTTCTSCSATQPMGAPLVAGSYVSVFNFNSQTGNIDFLPIQTGNYVMAVQVNDYHNGVLVGTTMRDIQILVTSNCTPNNSPSLIKKFIPSNVSGATVVDSTHLSLCPGGTMTFDLPATDPDANNYLIDSTNATLIMPGSTVSVIHHTGARDTAILHVSWTPLLSDTGFHYLSVTVSDTACPKPGKQTYSFIISVITGTNAGPDKYLSCRPFGSVTMSAVGAGGIWSTPSGNPAATTIVTPSSPTTTITGFTFAGVYKYVWSAGTCRDTAYVIVTEKPNAGPDINICQNLPATMAAVGTGTWTILPGNPAVATINNTTSPTTSITGFTVAGTYRFAWNFLTCKDTAQVIVTASPSAGSDRSICQYSTTTAIGLGTGTWTALASNPTTTTISSPNAASTVISGFAAAGSYYFIYGNPTCQDSMVVVVSTKPDAGPDQTICSNTTVTTAAVGGGGTGGSTADQYSFTYSSGGTLQSMTGAITACGPNDDSAPNAPANIGFTFYFEGLPYTQFEASPDGWLRLGSTAAVAEFANSITSSNNVPRISPYWDDMATGTTGSVSYLVTGTAPNRILVVQWFVTIPRSTLGAANSTFQLWLYEGTNVVQARYGTMGSATMSATVGLTGTNSLNFNSVTLLSASASNTVANNNNAIQPPSGTVGTYTPPLPTGTWSALATNPAATTIVSVNSPNTDINGFTTAGTYSFVWSLGGCTDTMKVFYVATPNAGNDQSICQNSGAVMTATASAGAIWTDPGFNPGTSTIANPSVATTRISGFSAPGSYLYYWGSGSCLDAVQINVTATPNAGPDQTICSNTPVTTNAISTGITSLTADQYSYTSSTGATLASMAGATTLVSSNIDDNPNITPVNIGFSFVYEGLTYTQFSASPDGWLRLGSNAAAAEYINSITSATNAPRLSAYWDDLATGTTGAVTYRVTGIAPNRVLVVQWFVNIPRNTLGAANTTFQMWLYETSGRIEYRYGTMGSSAMTATVGLTGATSTQYNAVTIAGGTSSNVVVNDNNAVQPTLGTMYTFLPPVPEHWTILPGNPAVTTIITPTSAVTDISGFTVPGTYNYTWSAGGCADTMSVIYISVNAGGDQSLCQNAIATMAATGSGSWTASAGNPSVATITSSASPTTTISGLNTPGVYQFTWGGAICSDVVALTVNAKPNAGPDQTICPNTTVTQAATGSSNYTAAQYTYSTSTGGTLASMVGATTLVGTNVDDDPNLTPANIGFTFTYEGIPYTQFSASPDGWLSLGATPATANYINAISAPGNAPLISALWDDFATGTTGAVTYRVTGSSPNRILVLNWFVTIPRNISGAANSSFQMWLYENGGRIELHYGTLASNAISSSIGLTGVVTTNFESVTTSSNTMSNSIANDANVTLPASGRVYTFVPPTPTGTWTALPTNPITTTITTPSSPTTTVTGLSSNGTYGYVWTTNGCADTMLVIVNRPNAGADKNICQNTTTSMSGTGTGTWTAVAGNPAVASIANATSPTTSISGFTAVGTYTFLWTNGGCADTALVIVTGKPNAGADVDVCQNTTATMAGTGTGTWTAQAGNPSVATIATPSSATTTITGLSTAGTYNFIFTNAGCTDTASVRVTAKPNAGADRSVCQNTTATMAAVGSGTWSALAGNPSVATITTPASATTTITALSAAGTYNFLWTNGGCFDTASVIVTAKPNAGADQTTCQFTTATMAGSGTGTWTAQTGNPAVAVITTATSPTTTITGLTAAGTYNFIWTNNGCTDTASVIVTAKPNAGQNQTTCQFTTATMAASGTGTWTAQAGNPALATITTATSPTTTITGLTVAGTYNFIWTNNGCTDTASVIVTAKPNAGSDQTVCQFTAATMSATGTGTWTAQAGNPATATIATASSPTTTITGLTVAGVYNFIWTNSGCTDTATVTVTAKPNAGADQTTCQFSTATMAATGTGAWSAIGSALGSTTIVNFTSPNATITGLTGGAGNYGFIWTSNGCTDTANVIVTAKPNAGSDQTVCQFTSATMSATGTGTWTAQAGNPATANIAVATSPTTSITGLTLAGTYNFIWTNSGCSDTASVTVTDKPNAGSDQTVCQYTTATMAATGTGTWSAQTGNPATATITTASSPTTTITGLTAAGTYNFIWTNNGCTDTASVIVSAKPNAGADFGICQFNVATMAAVGTGTWSALSTNPIATTITLATSATTTITGFTLTGTYGFVFTNNGCTDTVLVTVTLRPNAGLDQSTCQFGSMTMGAVGTGTWTAAAGNPGTATITTPTSANTTITGFSAAGTYYFLWSSGGCYDTANVVVTAKPNAGIDQTVCQFNTATMGATGTGLWTAFLTNPAIAVITAPTSPTTSVTGLNTIGTYTFVWSNTGCTDTMTLTVTTKPNAGLDQNTCQFSTATMAATGTGTWLTMAGNPATTVVVTSTSPTTIITGFTVAGTYRYIWSNGAGCSDTASVIVTAKPNAGTDQTICQYTATSLAATGTGAWTALATNPATTSLTNATSATTAVSGFTVSGAYGFVWTVNGCTDTMLVNVTAKPNAGTDQTICQFTTATMAATGSGTWTAQTGNPSVTVIASATSATTSISGFSTAGTYNFIWTNSGCTDTMSVNVTAKPNAGSDQTTCQFSTATMAAVGTGTWSALATNPAVATIANTTSNTTSISGFTLAGTYGFVWTNNGCTDTANVIVIAKPNAGSDQTICQFTNATMSATGTGAWTAQTGNPATGTITTAASPTTSISGFTVAGTYSFIWTSNGCSDTATVTVTAKPNAGSDQTICQFTTATMSATGTGTWTAFATNPATTTFANNTLATTSISGFTAAGTYNFVWTNNGCTDTAKVIVTAKPNAGSDQTICQYSSATMSATGTGTWTAMTGNPATVTIATATSPTTAITGFAVAGAYSLIWTINGCTDTTVVNVTAKPDAGADQNLGCFAFGMTATMAAVGTGTWSSLATNPAATTITTASSATSTIIGFTLPGTYNYVWTVNGCTDTMSINIAVKPNAGADQSTCQFSSATMAATGTGTWSAMAGNPSVANIVTPASPTTVINGFTAAGVYSFIWSNAGCTDTATVTVTAKPNAGSDQTICQYTTTTMSASGTGTWTALGTNPSVATIANTASATTGVSGFTAAGAYGFVWTVNGCTDTAFVNITAKPNAGADQTICQFNPATMAATGTGTWTAFVSNPSLATITNTTSPTTTITGLNTIGTYTFVWTNNGCTDTVSLIVIDKPNAGGDQSTCQFSTATMAAAGTGTWSIMAGNPAVTIIANTTSATTSISGFSVAGTYYYIWSAGSCTDTAAVIVTAKPNAGSDQIICQYNNTTLAATGTGSWSALASNPAAVTFTNAGSATSGVSGFTISGTYGLVWTVNGCTDTMNVNVTAKPNAGTDQTICEYTSTVMAATGTGNWSALATNPTTTVIANASSATTSISGFIGSGNYDFVWTVNGCTDTVNINVQLSPNAGPDQNIGCLVPGSFVTMAGTGIGTWSELATNPATTAITNTSLPTTTITGFTIAGTYVYTITNGTCTDTAQVVVTTKPVAGADQTICQNSSTLMTATGSGTWTAMTGNPATISFASTSSPTTSVNGFTVAGIYNMIWSFSGCSDTVQVTVLATPSAGADQIICQYNATNMTGSGTGTWTALATNPATTTITTPASATTSVSGFTVAGTYGFVFANAQCQDTMTITVTAKPDAGADQTICQYTNATMAGIGTGTWSALATNPAGVSFTNVSSATTNASGFSASGSYDLVWTVNGCSDTMTINVTAKPNAGTDQTICQYTDATMAASGTGDWTALSTNPATITIANTNSPTTGMTGFTTAGTYGFVWMVNGCTDTVNVIVTAKPDAGADQTTCQYSTATMAGVGTGTWSALASNPAAVSFTNAASATTTVSGFAASGAYALVWTVDGCTDTMTVNVTAKPDAGTDQTICQFTDATMAATGSGVWSELSSNPATVTIANTSSATTSITGFNTAGTYGFVWTINGCTDTTNVIVTAKPDAGADQTICQFSTATMAGVGSGTWSALASNPSTVTFANAGSATTSVSGFSASGTYSLIWTVIGCTDTMAVTVTAKPDAGTDQTICQFTDATMAATGTGTWSALASNSIAVTIANTASATTNITGFTTAGTYGFIWTANGCTDTANVIVTAKPNAGTDQTTCQYSTATMAAAGTGAWTSFASNPAVVSFANANSATTSVSGFSASGTYTFVWTVNGCTDTMTISVTAKPDAGADQSICQYFTTSLAAVGTGTWSALSTNPAVATIANTSSATSGVSGFTTAGSYKFVWTVNGCTDTMEVLVEPKPNAGTDQTVCINADFVMTATGRGTWSALSTNPAGAVVTMSTNPVSPVTFTTAGAYSFIWTNGSSCSDTVTLSVVAAPTATFVGVNGSCTNTPIVRATAAGGTSPYTYSWTGGSTADSVANPTVGTNYIVTVSDANHCTDTASGTVSTTAVNVTLSVDSNSVSCPGRTDGRIVVTATPAHTYTYQWGGATSATDSITGLSAGTYTVTATDATGCSATASYTLINPSPATLEILPSDTTIYKGTSAQLNTAFGPYSSTSATYSWLPATGLSCVDCPDPIATPTDSFNIYTLTVTYNNGCIVTASDTIHLIANDTVILPTAFTPNGDGVNDEFIVLGRGVKNLSISIYNRWGEQVFTTTDITVGWDGFYKSAAQPGEVYTYFLTVDFIGGGHSSKQGTLTLIR